MPPQAEIEVVEESRDITDGTITGYASVFYDGSSDTEFTLGRAGGQVYVERIMPTAFDAVLANGDDVVGLFNHDRNLVLGRTSSGTMELFKDATGLHYSILAGNTNVAKDVMKHRARGDIRGSSFGFRVTDENTVNEEGKHVRQIHSVELIDVGPVTHPAYDGTNDKRFLRRFVKSDKTTYVVRGEPAREGRSYISGMQAALVEAQDAAVAAQLAAEQLVTARLRSIDLDAQEYDS